MTQHFADIFDLLDYVEEKLIRDMLEKLTSALTNHEPQEVLRQLALVYDYYGLYVSIMMGPKGDQAFVAKYTNAVKPFLYFGLNLDESDPRMDIICEFSAGAVISSIAHWYQNGKIISSEELAYMLHTMLIKGLYKMLDQDM